jgi:hypothetical protein
MAAPASSASRQGRVPAPPLPALAPTPLPKLASASQCSNSGVAVGGTSVAGGFAGYFNDPVFIAGSMTAMGAKAAAVRSMGEPRRVYSLESPESWFEDFGSGQLTGRARDSVVGARVCGHRAYRCLRVFLTANGDSQSLYISERRGFGFTVRGQQSGKSNIAFDYRVVVERADIEGDRLEHVDELHSLGGSQEPVLDHSPKPPSFPDTSDVPSKR